MAKSQILLAFKQQDTPTGVTRETVKQMAEVTGLNETAIIHLALARMAQETIPMYEPDDGPRVECRPGPRRLGVVPGPARHGRLPHEAQQAGGDPGEHPAAGQGARCHRSPAPRACHPPLPNPEEDHEAGLNVSLPAPDVRVTVVLRRSAAGAFAPSGG